MHRNGFELSVLINGKPVREYEHEGLLYLEGRNGSEFELLLRNNTGKKVEAVISVDGLDVLDGQEGLAKKPGYLIYPYSSLRISGWRLDEINVAHFVFAGKDESYAKSKDMPRNVGVIGVAIFKEKEMPRYIPWYPPVVIQPLVIQPYTVPNWNPIYHRGSVPLVNPTVTTSIQLNNTGGMNQGSLNCSNNVSSKYSAPVADVQYTANCTTTEAAMSSQGLGTGFGRKTESAVTNVNFERASTTPDEVLQLRYNDRENLIRRGIKVAQTVPEDLAYRDTAKPFEDLGGGCTPPTNWKG